MMHSILLSRLFGGAQQRDKKWKGVTEEQENGIIRVRGIEGTSCILAVIENRENR